MMRPKPRSTIESTTCLEVLNRPLRLVEITAFQSSGVMRLNVVSRVMPALLTRMSIWPTSSRTWAKARTVSFQSVISLVMQ
ncbi:hypothetical protein D3C81_1702120 [compost metagenome]